MATKPIVDVSSRPAQVVLTLVRGDQWLRPLRFRQVTETGDPVDLTGSTLTAAVYKTLGGVKEADVPITITGSPTAGNATIDLNEALTSSLSAEAFPGDPSGTHWVLVKMVDSVAVTRTMVQIKMTVVPGS